MTKDQEVKIKRFMSDTQMSGAVYNVLLESFLKERTKDVHIMAAAYLAVDFLRQAWRELERTNPEQEGGEIKLKQVGM